MSKIVCDELSAYRVIGFKDEASLLICLIYFYPKMSELWVIARHSWNIWGILQPPRQCVPCAKTILIFWTASKPVGQWSTLWLTIPFWHSGPDHCESGSRREQTVSFEKHRWVQKLQNRNRFCIASWSARWYFVLVQIFYEGSLLKFMISFGYS